MDDRVLDSLPSSLEAIWQDSIDAGFSMSSDRQTGAFLRTMAATRRNARLLEIGTGTGLSAAWILDGMDTNSTLDSVDHDERFTSIARRHLEHDSRFRLHIQDGTAFLMNAAKCSYDFMFADSWPGKYTDFDLAISLLSIGGLYIIDDMLPQPNWPIGHEQKVRELCKTLETRRDLCIVKLAWSTGLIVATKVA